MSTKLIRPIDSYRHCNPKAMAFDQSDNAKMFAFQDMARDVIALWEENRALKSLLCEAAYPRRGTAEEGMTIQQFATKVQAVISHEEAVNL